MSLIVSVKDREEAKKIKEWIIEQIFAKGEILITSMVDALEVTATSSKNLLFHGYTYSDVDAIKKSQTYRTRGGLMLYLPDPQKLNPENPQGEDLEKSRKAIFGSDGTLTIETPNEFAMIDYLVASLKDMMLDIQEKQELEYRLKVMVHHKKGKKVIERPAWFHVWTQDSIEKDGEIITQDLAICQFLDDGHIERISWKNIRFVEEWE